MLFSNLSGPVNQTVWSECLTHWMSTGAAMSCRVTSRNSAESLWTPLSGFSDKVQDHKFLINTLSRHPYWLFDANHSRVTENGTAVCWASYQIVISRASLKAKAHHKYRTRLTSSFNLIRKDSVGGYSCYHFSPSLLALWQTASSKTCPRLFRQ